MKRPSLFRRLLQFRLRTVLLLMAAIAVASGHYASMQRTYLRERAALAQIPNMELPVQPSAKAKLPRATLVAMSAS